MLLIFSTIIPLHPIAADFSTSNVITLAQTNREVNIVREMSNGEIMIGGNFTKVNGEVKLGLARLNPDGSLDPSFKPEVAGPEIPGSMDYESGIVTVVKDSKNLQTIPNYYVQVWEIIEDGDGYIVIGENYQYYSYVYGFMRLNRDGSIDKSFRKDYPERIGFGPLRAFRDRESNLIVSGNYQLENKNSIRIAKFDPQGNFIPSFSPNPTYPVLADGNYGLANLGDGSILIALGKQSDVNQVSSTQILCRSIARYSSDGKIDSEFTSYISGQSLEISGVKNYLGRLTGLVPIGDGRVLLVGGFTSFPEKAKSDPCDSGRGGYFLLNQDGKVDANFKDHNLQPQNTWAAKPDGSKILLAALLNTQPLGSIVLMNPDGSIDGRLKVSGNSNIDDFFMPTSVVLSKLGRYAIMAAWSQNTLKKEPQKNSIKKIYLNPSKPSIDKITCLKSLCEISIASPIASDQKLPIVYHIVAKSLTSKSFVDVKLEAQNSKIPNIIFQPNEKYNVQVTAINASGSSQDSETYVLGVLGYAPVAPVMKSELVKGKVTVLISVPDSGGGEIKKTKIEVLTPNGTWIPYMELNTARSFELVPTRDTTLLKLRSQVVTDFGVSEWSETISINSKGYNQSIICVKGKASKKVSGTNPKCPIGFVKKST